jgi:hypothetical protein
MTIKGEISGYYKWEKECLGDLKFRTNWRQGGDSGHGTKRGPALEQPGEAIVAQMVTKDFRRPVKSDDHRL